MKRDSKVDYYHKYFEKNNNNFSNMWKGIQSIININKSSRRDIKLLNDNGNTICDPKKNVEQFNKYFVNVGLNVDSKITKAVKHFKEYMANMKVNKTFFLTTATPKELFDIILAFDVKKSSGPNSIPVYILKISICFFSNKLCDIVNLSFKTGIFPD